jgi:hypothetical protein
MYFDRKKYYNQSEATTLFEISVPEFKQLIIDKEQELGVVKKEVDLGTHKVNAIYVLCDKFKELNIPKRPL